MSRVFGFRLTCAALLITAAMSTVAHAQQPTVVFSIRGVQPLLNDIDFLGTEAGQDGTTDQVEQLINAATGGNGLKGIDLKKPLGIYWNATKDGPPEMPVAFVPVANAADLEEMLKNLAPDLEVEDGTWTASVNGIKLFGKVSAGYLFISNVPPSKLPDAAKISNAKYDITLDVNMASIPDPYKELFLTQVEEGAKRNQEEQPEPKNEAERLGREWGLNGTLAIIKSIVNDGDRLTLGIEVDQKARNGAFDVSLTSKAGTDLAAALTAYSKIQPVFAGIGSESAPLRITLSHPSPATPEELDSGFDAFTKIIGQEIDNDERFENDQDKEIVKGLVTRFFDLFRATAKTGSLHAGLVLEPGGEKVRVLGAAKLANGDDAAKLLDDAIKVSKAKPELGKFQLDVAKHAGARIHSVNAETHDKTEELFGDEPFHLAFRADSLWMSLGGDNLNALKKALDAKPAARVSTSPISIQLKPAALAVLMHEDDEDFVERAKKVVGKPGDKLNIDVAPIASGAKLRIEFGVDLLKLADDSAE